MAYFDLTAKAKVMCLRMPITVIVTINPNLSFMLSNIMCSRHCSGLIGTEAAFSISGSRTLSP
jgi:hypothetical protein